MFHHFERSFVATLVLFPARPQESAGFKTKRPDPVDLAFFIIF